MRIGYSYSYLSKECLHGSSVPQGAQAVCALHEGLAQVSGAGPEIKKCEKKIIYALNF